MVLHALSGCHAEMAAEVAHSSTISVGKAVCYGKMESAR
jgi:hypothetical protein